MLYGTRQQQFHVCCTPPCVRTSGNMDLVVTHLRGNREGRVTPKFSRKIGKILTDPSSKGQLHIKGHGWFGTESDMYYCRVVWAKHHLPLFIAFQLQEDEAQIALTSPQGCRASHERIWQSSRHKYRFFSHIWASSLAIFCEILASIER